MSFAARSDNKAIECDDEEAVVRALFVLILWGYEKLFDRVEKLLERVPGTAIKKIETMADLESEPS